MSEQNPQYKTGDIVNGHYLGPDNQWHAIPAQPAASTAKKGFLRKHPILSALGGLFALVVFFSAIGAAVGGEGGDADKPVALVDTTTKASPAAETPSSTPTPSPTKTTATPTPTPTPTKAAPKPKPKPKPKPVKAVAVDKRTMAKIIKSPDNYVGKKYIVYGEITQFDSATGTDTFLANTAYKNTTSYGFFDGENALYTGDEDRLSDFVEGDVFRASVTVVSSFTYDTQIGGSTTVPMFQIDSIKRVGNNS